MHCDLFWNNFYTYIPETIVDWCDIACYVISVVVYCNKLLHLWHVRDIGDISRDMSDLGYPDTLHITLHQ